MLPSDKFGFWPAEQVILSVAEQVILSAVLFLLPPIGTPAGTMLAMIEAVLRNEMPSLRDSLVVRTALLHNYDIFAPVNLRKNLQGAKLDVSDLLGLL